MSTNWEQEESKRLHDKMMFDIALQLHLWKCELEYRAKCFPEGSCVPWLADDCCSTERIVRKLREIGFKVKRIVDEEPWPGEVHKWVETTSGIVVYVNSEYTFGLVASSKVQSKRR